MSIISHLSVSPLVVLVEDKHVLHVACQREPLESGKQGTGWWDQAGRLLTRGIEPEVQRGAGGVSGDGHRLREKSATLHTPLPSRNAWHA